MEELILSNNSVTMDKLINLCKGRGFIYPGSEIYGGLANTWDYGPLGVELKNNIKAAWRKKFIQESTTNIGLDSSILMNPSVWKSSGHLDGFSDPLMDCKSCKTRHRADELIENFAKKKKIDVLIPNMTNKEMSEFIETNNIVCPVCGKKDFTPIRQFNLMFKTFQGVTDDSANTIFLRPETAQGIFVNFKNIARTTRKRIPFGVAQIGKSFRNEITPGNFIYRTREFEQMEMEFFCKPGTELEWFKYWKDFCVNWLTSLNIRKDSIKLRDHTKEELSHYSNATTDIEFAFPFGWGELWGIASRTDFDLKCHIKGSGENLEYLDPVTNEKYIPYCIEPALGVERVLLAFLADAYAEEIVDGETRTILKLHPYLAPFKAAVLPLQKNLSEKANAIYTALSKHFNVDFDESGSIGKRYRRQDEVGTPFCITVDFDTLENDTVTIRDRDSMNQIRVPVKDLISLLKEKTEF